MRSPFEPKDRDGRPIRAGDIVRVVGVPNLSGMSKEGLSESLPVFKYLLGKYKRVAAFDEYGLARLDFAIRRGRYKGQHSVMIEPFLLRMLQRSGSAFERTGQKRRAAGYSGVKEGDRVKTKPTPPQTIDEYIAGFPPDVQARLQKIREAIRKAAPEAGETISYRIPTFTLNGTYLVYFAAHKHHIGLYPAPIGQMEFKDELTAYQSGKGTLQFPLDQLIPLGLIRKIVRFLVKDNMARAQAAWKRKKRR